MKKIRNLKIKKRTLRNRMVKFHLLNEFEYQILEALEEQHKTSVAIASELNKNGSTVRKYLGKLIQKGFVRRTERSNGHYLYSLNIHTYKFYFKLLMDLFQEHSEYFRENAKPFIIKNQKHLQTISKIIIDGEAE